MGENSKDVSITFDGETVGSLTVTSQDVDSPQYIEFTVHKDPGVYPCEISVTSNLSDGESVGLSTFYVKPEDMEDWFDIRPNGFLNNDGTRLVESASSAKTIVALFFDEPATLNIEVTSAYDTNASMWSKRYRHTSFQEAIDIIENLVDNNPDNVFPEVIAKMAINLENLKEHNDVLNDPTIRY